MVVIVVVNMVDEIMDGDTITIPELNGTFVPKIYENTSLHYIPY